MLFLIRNIVNEGKVAVKKVSTEENPAYMITKSLPSSKFNYCLEFIGVLESLAS